MITTAVAVVAAVRIGIAIAGAISDIGVVVVAVASIVSLTIGAAIVRLL